ncbi:hypothetical protein [Streptomyces canus]|nr:hypothetical protein [Streptomyces canus]WSD88057.1 hypothetical protein OG925_28885 [Streptomyces canus]
MNLTTTASIVTACLAHDEEHPARRGDVGYNVVSSDERSGVSGWSCCQ